MSMLNPKTMGLNIVAITIALVSILNLPSRPVATDPMVIQTARSSGAVNNLRELIARLKHRGKKVRRKEKVEQPFLSPKGQIISVDDQDVQVFEYQSVRAAAHDAKKISGARSTSMAMWIAPPHFFNAGRLIVLYVGKDSSVLKVLTDLLGPEIHSNSQLGDSHPFALMLH